MSKVLIVGAGGVGRVVAHKCAQMRDVFGEVWLASRTKSKCDRISAETGGVIKTAQVDADNSAELSSLIKNSWGLMTPSGFLMRTAALRC